MGDTYFECFANTENNTQSSIERGFRLTRNKLQPPTNQPSHPHTPPTPLPSSPPPPLPPPPGRPPPKNPHLTHLIPLPQHRPPLTMSHKRPPHPTILQLLRANLPRKSSITLIKHVLRCDFDARTEVFAHEEEEERGGGDDDFYELWG